MKKGLNENKELKYVDLASTILKILATLMLVYSIIVLCSSFFIKLIPEVDGVLIDFVRDFYRAETNYTGIKLSVLSLFLALNVGLFSMLILFVIDAFKEFLKEILTSSSPFTDKCVDILNSLQSKLIVMWCFIFFLDLILLLGYDGALFGFEHYLVWFLVYSAFKYLIIKGNELTRSKTKKKITKEK